MSYWCNYTVPRYHWPFLTHRVANLPDDSIKPISNIASTGVYYGYAQILPPNGEHSLSGSDLAVLPMVMSLGWNPFYKNEQLTAVET